LLGADVGGVDLVGPDCVGVVPVPSLTGGVGVVNVTGAVCVGAVGSGESSFARRTTNHTRPTAAMMATATPAMMARLR
jgi:hypothetical protein